jgi:hypothetical protein
MASNRTPPDQAAYSELEKTKSENVNALDAMHRAAGVFDCAAASCFLVNTKLLTW